MCTLRDLRLIFINFLLPGPQIGYFEDILLHNGDYFRNSCKIEVAYDIYLILKKFVVLDYYICVKVRMQ